MTNFNLPSLDNADISGKRAFVRCDFDVPLEGSVIADETRLISSVSTIEHLLENGSTVIAAGHLARPDGVSEKYSLKPVANWFADEFPGSNLTETRIGKLSAWQIKENFYVLENLRFFKEEEENDEYFAQRLASLADFYVNEAFGSSHRAHASIVGISKFLPHFAGFHLIKEVKVLSGILDNPKRPLTIIAGGAKIETKLPLISKMHEFADYVLVGGKIAAQDKILIKEQHEEITKHKAMLIVADLNSDNTDITEMSLENFSQIVGRSETIVWNGPMGYIEGGFDRSTMEVAIAVIKSPAYKIVGGGDTVGYLNKKGLLNSFDFASTGGGAMLEFLSGEDLPGLTALG